MKRVKKSREKKKSSVWLSILKAELLAVAVTLAFIALFSFLLYQGVLGIEYVSFINTAIKIIGSLTAVLVTVFTIKEKRLLMCIISGIIYTISAYLILSLMIGQFEINAGILSDMVIGAGIGAITALLSASSHKKRA